MLCTSRPERSWRSGVASQRRRSAPRTGATECRVRHAVAGAAGAGGPPAAARGRRWAGATLDDGAWRAPCWRRERRRRRRERADAEVVDRLRHRLEIDHALPLEVAAVQRAIADETDDAGTPPDDAKHGIDRIRREVHAIVGAAGDAQAMRNISSNTLAVERLEAASRRHALVELAHLRQLQFGPQLELADQNDLQQFLRRLEIGQDANLFEQRRRQVLRLVDDEDGECLKRHERPEKLVQRVAQVRMRCARHPAALQIVDRHDAEVEEQHLQQVLARDERIGHERREGLPIELLQHRFAERRLAGADVACQHDQPFAAANREQQIFERAGVRGALVQKFRIGRQAEWLLTKPVVRLVGEKGRRSGRAFCRTGFSVGNLSTEYSSTN